IPLQVSLVLIAAVSVATLSVSSKKLAPSQMAADSRLRALRATGQPQLISVQPLPGETDAQMCVWPAPGSHERLVAMMPQERAAARGASATAANGGNSIDRPPVRMI